MDRTLGKGYVRDTDEDRAARRYVGHLLGAPPPRLARSASLEDLCVVRDQGYTSSCVGQAIAQAARLRLLAEGVSVPLLSALFPYAGARAEERARKDEPLDDAGCRPAAAISAVRRDGLATEEAWPFSEEAVNFDVPFDVFEDANKFLPYTIGGEYAIDLGGEHRVQAVMHALEQRYPVVFGTEVDRAFEDQDGRTPIGPTQGESLGGHMMCVVGYETLPSGVVFRVVNSWGTSWGDHGFFNALPSFLTDPLLGDLFVFEMQPVAAKKGE